MYLQLQEKAPNKTAAIEDTGNACTDGAGISCEKGAERYE